LCTAPKIATENILTIPLMDGFFDQQFQINDSADAIKFWQVYDRTTDTLVPQEK